MLDFITAGAMEAKTRGHGSGDADGGGREGQLFVAGGVLGPGRRDGGERQGGHHQGDPGPDVVRVGELSPQDPCGAEHHGHQAGGSRHPVGAVADLALGLQCQELCAVCEADGHQRHAPQQGVGREQAEEATRELVGSPGEDLGGHVRRAGTTSWVARSTTSIFMPWTRFAKATPGSRGTVTAATVWKRSHTVRHFSGRSWSATRWLRCAG